MHPSYPNSNPINHCPVAAILPKNVSSQSKQKKASPNTHTHNKRQMNNCSGMTITTLGRPGGGIGERDEGRTPDGDDHRQQLQEVEGLKARGPGSTHSPPGKINKISWWSESGHSASGPEWGGILMTKQIENEESRGGGLRIRWFTPQPRPKGILRSVPYFFYQIVL